MNGAVEFVVKIRVLVPKKAAEFEYVYRTWCETTRQVTIPHPF